MNALTIVIIAVIATAALMGIGFIILERRKGNPGEKLADNFFNSWEKIRPILTNLFIDGVALYDAAQGTYEDLEDFAVDWLLRQINGLDVLLPAEKELFTRDRIVKLIRPRLQEWYDYKIKSIEIAELVEE